jgi:uncharacterized protein (DUF1800 family)
MAAIDWNEKTAAHLFRRAAFGATEDELAASLQHGFEATIHHLVDYDVVPNEALDARLSSMALDVESREGSVRFWLTRMMFTARPLQERMALFWHDHFATSAVKVFIGVVLEQIDLFRRAGMGPFDQLCEAVARDIAMLNWLDNYTSHKDHPNENFGRELLELFTLGRGHYSELDVQAAARAFTGWGTDLRYYANYIFRPDWHDYGSKTFLGETGNWNGEDIIRIIVARPVHARFLAEKLFAYFAYDQPEPEVVDRLAAVYTNTRYNVRELVRAILTSPEMYSSRAIGTKIKSPIEFVVLASRQLNLEADVDGAVDSLSVQGQVPYEPPDVSGWTGGRSWIGSSAMIGRMAFAERAARSYIPAFSPGASAGEVADRLLHRLGPLVVSDEIRKTLIDYTGDAKDGRRLQGLAQLVLSLPESQMI